MIKVVAFDEILDYLKQDPSLREGIEEYEKLDAEMREKMRKNYEAAQEKIRIINLQAYMRQVMREGRFMYYPGYYVQPGGSRVIH